MKKSIQSMVLTLASVVALCLTPPTQAAHPKPEKLSTYKDRVAGTITAATPIPGGVHLPFSVVGKATVVGKITTLGSFDVNLADLTFTGENTITAEDGSTILLTITGRLVPTGDPSEFTILLETVFVDGTGRFDDVVGGFVGEGVLHTVPGFVGSTFQGEGIGLISKPEKRKK